MFVFVTFWFSACMCVCVFACFCVSVHVCMYVQYCAELWFAQLVGDKTPFRPWIRVSGGSLSLSSYSPQTHTNTLLSYPIDRFDWKTFNDCFVQQNSISFIDASLLLLRKSFHLLQFISLTDLILKYSNEYYLKFLDTYR